MSLFCRRALFGLAILKAIFNTCVQLSCHLFYIKSTLCTLYNSFYDYYQYK